MANLLYLNQFKTTTLSVPGGINDSQTTGIVMQSDSGLDTTKPGIACITYTDPISTSNAEWIEYTAINSTTKEFTGVTRGAEGYSAKSHSNGVTIAFPVSESHVNRLADALSIGGDPTNGVTTTLDEDDMASDSDTAVPTQQSVKAYVDNNATSTDGWTEYSAVVPTRTTADDPTYVVTFSGVDLTDRISVGMKVKWTQNSTVRYGIVTAIAFSTNTTLTLYGGTDYDVDDTATHVISAFNYSPHKSPFGFPMSPAKWTILLSTTTGTQTPPTQNTWHNLGGSGALHIGDWYVRFWAGAYTDTGTAGVKVTQITVSTANNSESDATYTIAQTDYDIKSATCMASWVRNFTVASKTTYFVNARTTQASQSNLGITRNRLEAVCAYL
jgi:hypothetical protein